MSSPETLFELRGIREELAEVKKQNESLATMNSHFAAINETLKKMLEDFKALVKWLTTGGLTAILLGGGGYAGYKKYKS